MHDLTKPLLRHNQREILKREIEQMERTGRSGDKRIDSPALSYKLRQARKQLDENSPQPLTGADKDKLAKDQEERLANIVRGMPSREEMRRAPGVEYRHRKWEGVNKPEILKWKNGELQLNPDSDDPDLANLERHRPHGAATAGLMLDGLIPGHQAMSSQAKENWPLGEPKADTALKQAKRAEKREGKRQMSPEHKAKAAANLAKARETTRLKRAARGL